MYQVNEALESILIGEDKSHGAHIRHWPETEVRALEDLIRKTEMFKWTPSRTTRVTAPSLSASLEDDNFEGAMRWISEFVTGTTQFAADDESSISAEHVLGDD